MRDFDMGDLFDNEPSGNMGFIASFDSMESFSPDFSFISGEELPILPLRGNMLFPDTMIPISIARKSSYKVVKEAEKKHSVIGVFSQKDDRIDDPEYEDMYTIGTLAKVSKVFKLPNGTQTALLRGLIRVKMLSMNMGTAYYRGNVESLPEAEMKEEDKASYSILRTECKEAAIKILQSSDNQVPLSIAIREQPEDTDIVNFICSNLNISNEERYQMLAEGDKSQRAYKLLDIINREQQFLQIKQSIQMRTREVIDKAQKEYYLRHEIEKIQEELGENRPGNNDIAELTATSKTKKWSYKAMTHFEKELNTLSHLMPGSPDNQVQYTYLRTLLSLPWNECSMDSINLKTAQKILDKRHYGMENVKERIIEHLAVLKIRQDFKSPILCLYGPPGVGKTSLGKSIAEAMKREYVRMSLGGMHDEAEIRGHRKTYIGAMPGQIIKKIIKAGTSNPVFVLDEIDKVVTDAFKGDPSSALLEVLDPEQNSTFHDNYLDCDYDLSNVMFIATANNISTIPTPLLDRMELIEVSGYITEEKIEIAKRHLLPKALEDVGLDKGSVKMNKAAIEKIIEDYTRESGVRNLEKQIKQVVRKIALAYAKGEGLPVGDIKAADIQKYLGTEPYSRDKYQDNDFYGVVTGLAWTSVGGEILFIETSIDNGKGGKLGLTGNLGDVMKESATIALQYLKEHCDMLGVEPEYFDTHNIHIHVPEGATPKDGPSAGITIATSLASAITRRKVRKGIAMTGEITLRGKVLPVGGIKEKILAAKRAGISDIIICQDNKKNIDDIPSKYLTGVTFHYVDTVKDVLDYALLKK